PPPCPPVAWPPRPGPRSSAMPRRDGKLNGHCDQAALSCVCRDRFTARRRRRPPPAQRPLPAQEPDMRRLIASTIALAIALAGCATGPRIDSVDRLALLRAHAGEPVNSILHPGRFSG